MSARSPLLTPEAAAEFATTGHIRLPHVNFPTQLISRLRDHFHALPASYDIWHSWFTPPRCSNGTKFVFRDRRCSYCCIDVSKERQGPLRKELQGLYRRHVYGEGTFLRSVAAHALQLGAFKPFACRFLIVSHDVFLSQDTTNAGFQAHFDSGATQLAFVGGEDITLYIALTDVDGGRGGRLGMLPRTADPHLNSAVMHAMYEPLRKLKGTIQEAAPAAGGGNGGGGGNNLRIDDVKQSPEAPRFRRLWDSIYRQRLQQTDLNTRMRKQLDKFQFTSMRQGEAILFSNQAYHNNERTYEFNHTRDTYLLRMHPVYDLEITMQNQLFHEPPSSAAPRAAVRNPLANRWLLDLKEGNVITFNGPINISTIPKALRYPIPARPTKHTRGRGGRI